MSAFTVLWHLLLAPPSAHAWVLYSPVARALSFKAYENSRNEAWASPATFNLDEVALRWSLPPSSYSDDGLGGGIAFALHRDFCERLIPLFPEDHSNFGFTLFLTCDDLRNTIKRAMDTWAINHKNLVFKDVTSDCAEVASTDGCPHAELFIVPEDVESDKAADLAAWVTHSLSEGEVDRNPWTTAGVHLDSAAGGIGVRTAKMTVRAPSSAADFCWYLDTSFCYGFHRARARRCSPPCGGVHTHARRTRSATHACELRRGHLHRLVRVGL